MSLANRGKKLSTNIHFNLKGNVDSVMFMTLPCSLSADSQEPKLAGETTQEKGILHLCIRQQKMLLETLQFVLQD